MNLTYHGYIDINDRYYYGEFLFDEEGEWITTEFYGVGTPEMMFPAWEANAYRDIMGDKMDLSWLDNQKIEHLEPTKGSNAESGGE